MAFITTIMDQIYYEDFKINRGEALSEKHFKYWWKVLVMQAFESESRKWMGASEFCLKTLCLLLLEGAPIAKCKWKIINDAAEVLWQYRAKGACDTKSC